ncbi:conserved exported hypothetical protein [Pseudomonas sp. OF001]|uniref:DUF2780 domain-containing protein n=1 Tax=Pseudomonas sp. OF001 TaxID=2772300 RepID=UPI001917D70F|nr:DUF2780 domain-containing protein [Pseudomonas sp. OF001]CAD5375860.1 conserved exported hypothetical protein [Pseudomonas sp. OF001]
MPLLRPLSLSVLLLVASAPAFAAAGGDTVRVSPVPADPALQVTPPVGNAPAQEAVAPAPAGAPAVSAPAGAASSALPGAAAALGRLANPQTLALIEQLGALQVTPQQAMGGVGALLGLAQSQLAGDQYAQLAGAVPGLALLGGNPAGADSGASGMLGRLGVLSGLLGGGASQAPQPAAPVDSLAGVARTFTGLGMESSLVGQFASILLQFLGNQGLAGSLLQSLGGIWGVPGALPPAPATGTPVASGSAT